MQHPVIVNKKQESDQGSSSYATKEIKIDKKFKKVSNFFFKLVDILKQEQKEKEAIKKLEKSIEGVSVGSLLGQFLFKNTDHTERLERYIHSDQKSLQFLLIMSGCSIALGIVVDYDTGKIAYQLNETPNIELAILQDKKNLPSTIQIKEISTSSLVKLVKEKSGKCEKKITDKLSYVIGEVNSFGRLQGGEKEFSVIVNKSNFKDVIQGLFENDKFEVSSKSGTSDDAEADLIVQNSGRKGALLVVKLGFNAGEDFVKADLQQYTNGLPKECKNIKVLILNYGKKGIIYKSTFIKRPPLQQREELLRKALNCKAIDFSKVKLLIEKMDDTVRNKDGNIALHLAAQINDLKTVRWLIGRVKDKESYIKSKGKDGMTVLHFIVQNGTSDNDFTIIDELLKHVNDKEKYVKTEADGKMTPLHYAAKSKSGSAEAIEKLLSYITKEEDKEKYVKAEADDKMTSLHYAAQSGNVEAIGKLLSYIPEGNREDYVMTNVCRSGKNPLHYAAKSGKVGAIEKLLSYITKEEDKEKYVKTKANNGMTPLHYAAQSGNVGAIKKLMKCVENQKNYVNTKNKNGDTALSLVLDSESINWKLVEFLVGKGADVNTKNKNGSTLSYLVYNCKEVGRNIKNLLIKEKAVFNTKTGDRNITIPVSLDPKVVMVRIESSGKNDLQSGDYVSQKSGQPPSKGDGSNIKTYRKKGKLKNRKINARPGGSANLAGKQDNVYEESSLCDSQRSNMESEGVGKKRLSLSDGEAQKPPEKKLKQSNSPKQNVEGLKIESSKQNAGQAESDGFQRQDKDLETLEEGNIIENSNLDFQKGGLSDSNEVGKKSNLDDSRQSDMELGVNGDESHVSVAKILVADGGEDHEKERYSQESSSEKSDSIDESISGKRAKLVCGIGKHLDHNGGTILHVLARLVNSEGIRTLVEKGADIDAVDEKGFTPFHYGVISVSNCKITRLFEDFLYCRAHPEIKACDGRDVYDILDDKGLAIREEKSRGCRYIHFVSGDHLVGQGEFQVRLIRRGRGRSMDITEKDIVDVLTTYYSYTCSYNPLLPIHVAAKIGNVKDLEFLIGIVNNVNDKSPKYIKDAPIHLALSNSSEPESAEEKIKVLIKAGA